MTFHQRIAVASEDFAEYKVGQRVMTVDGYPGRVTAIMDGPYAQTESYDVTLDGGMGGGEYKVGDLSPYVANTASRQVESEFVEASTAHFASDDYPELAEILRERQPNENVKYAAFKAADTTDEDDADPKDEQQAVDEATSPEPLPIDPPDACSFCGNDSFEDAQNTGRGTRMRCSACKGTMTSWGGQWQPESPGSSQNDASDQPDFRSGGGAGVASLPDANFKVSSVGAHPDSEYVRDGHDEASALETAIWRVHDKHKARNQQAWEDHRAEDVPYQHQQDEDAHLHEPYPLNGIPENVSDNFYQNYGRDPEPHERASWTHSLLDPHPGKNEVYSEVAKMKVAPSQHTSSKDDHGLRFHLTASWHDVREKAKRLRSEGFVKITGATHSAVLGEVTGDTAVYETELKYLPGSKHVANYYCGCAWANYANEPRFGQFKRFQNRLCSHALALQFEAQSQSMFGKTVYAALGDDPMGDFEPSDQSFDLHKLIPHPSGEVQGGEGSELAGLAEEAPIVAAAMLDPDGIYATDVDLLNPPIYAHALMLQESAYDPVESIHYLAQLGADRKLAQRLVFQAAQEATADADGGQGMDAMAPRQNDRDKSDLAKKPKHHLHHTNDGREHAPNWGWGIPYYLQGNLGVCPQCNGSGCGHCGGVGQVQQGDVPVADDNTGDAGDLSNGIAAAGSLNVFAELEEYNMLPGGTAEGEPWVPRTPLSGSENPASTGWATGDDPANWNPGTDLSKNTFGNAWTASVKENPTVSGVALHAQDTGRVLMIQRSNNDESDPARGTWEFPGGHHEDGDQTSLHAGIREWEEEVGQHFPEGGVVKGTYFNGPYALHKVEIPEEGQVSFGEGRSTVNPDDPDGDDHEQAAWWDPHHAEENPALRKELKKPKVWDHVRNATLHKEPEGALPSTDGAEDEETPEQIVARFQASAGASTLLAGMEDQPAFQRVAMKVFDHQEQQSLINEGARERVRARNFDNLDISGTHYALLDEEDNDDLGSFL